MKTKTLITVSIIFSLSLGCTEEAELNPANIHHENWERINGWELEKIRAGISRRDFTLTFPSEPHKNRHGYFKIEVDKANYSFKDFTFNPAGHVETNYKVDLSYDGKVYKMDAINNDVDYYSTTKQIYDPRNAVRTSINFGQNKTEDGRIGRSHKKRLFFDDGTEISESEVIYEDPDKTTYARWLGQTYPDGSYESSFSSDTNESESFCDVLATGKDFNVPEEILRDKAVLLDGWELELKGITVCGILSENPNWFSYRYTDQSGGEVRFGFRIVEKRINENLTETTPQYIYFELTPDRNASYYLNKHYGEPDVSVRVVYYNQDGFESKTEYFRFETFEDYQKLLKEEEPEFYTEYKYTFF